MSTKIHELLILPGSKVRFLCVDGLSPATVLDIDHIFSFGSGKMEFVNCGAGNIYMALQQAFYTMGKLYYDKLDHVDQY